VAVEISNEPAASALGVTAERDGWGQLIVAVGDIHTAESFPDSLRQKEQRAGRWVDPTQERPAAWNAIAGA
jgi:hypothetical protein